jgi:aryl-alcohol dehydrogenase-like predicted oxidoreductase
MEAHKPSYDPIFDAVELGIGTWAWGDRLVWGYGNKYREEDITQAFNEAIENKVAFFDTAEVYGQGKSESFLGKLLPGSPNPVKIATKMMPFPWRMGKNALRHALRGSLTRLRLEQVDLYQMHWPLLPFPVEHWMEQMASVHHEGLIKAIGVSNYDLNQTIKSVTELKKHVVSLASNQLEYHLLERRIEKNGLMDYCLENGIKVIAYSPLAMGILSGKYTPENPPKGARASQYTPSLLTRIQPLIKLLKRIGQDHEGKTASQVALNWVICKGALPIPGAKNAKQASENAGATGWMLTNQEVEQLDEISESVSQMSPAK